MLGPLRSLWQRKREKEKEPVTPPSRKLKDVNGTKASVQHKENLPISKPAKTNGTTPSETRPEAETAKFTLKPEPVENLRPLRVVVIGAGFSGIVAAIRIPEKLRNVDLTVYEKSEAVGGVWWLNKYPGMFRQCREINAKGRKLTGVGVACDIPCKRFSFSLWSVRS